MKTSLGGGLSSLCHLCSLDIFPSTLISFRNVYWPNHTKLGSIHFWIKWDLEKWGYYTPEATEDNLPLILPSSQERTSIRKSGNFFGKICTKELKRKKIARDYFTSLRRLQPFSVSWRNVTMTVNTSLIILAFIEAHLWRSLAKEFHPDLYLTQSW